MRRCQTFREAEHVLRTQEGSIKWLHFTFVLALFRVALLSREGLVIKIVWHRQRSLPERPWTALGTRIAKLKFPPCAHIQHCLTAPKCLKAESQPAEENQAQGVESMLGEFEPSFRNEQWSQQPLNNIFPLLLKQNLERDSIFDFFFVFEHCGQIWVTEIHSQLSCSESFIERGHEDISAFSVP